MADFTLRAGDRLPSITARLQDADGAAVNLQNATVVFVMVGALSRLPIVEQPATILVENPADLTSSTQINVQYDWQAGDTATPGLYYAEWRVTYGATSRIETFPNDSYLTISITRQADG